MGHRTTAELEAELDDIRRAPADDGRVELVVSRPTNGTREVLSVGVLDPERGLLGDNWLARGNRRTPDGSADPLAQITVINARLSSLVAVDPDRRSLAGDQLHVDLDLDVANLPAGSQLAVGTAVIEVTAKMHLGCAKFIDRFGRDAMRFVNSPEGRALRLRGLNARVVVSGSVRPGDAVRKVRPAS
ncbi:MAG: hypothetical protein PV358_16885 [Acidimicrobiales bacterium]|nr:hypothetical protein [Acidimicrobiales bacterium]